MSIVKKIMVHADSMPDKVALLIKDVPVTYLKLATEIKSIAAKLKACGVNTGECVLITASNSYEFIATYFAVHYAGGTVLNVAPDADDSYRTFVIEKAKPYLCIDDVSEFSQNLSDTDLLPEVEFDPDHIADLMFTSGTTGEPKGVVLTHAQIVAATEHIIEQVRNTAEDVELLLMPLYHSFGMGRMRTTLYAGGTLVLGYPLQRLKGVFKAIESHKVTGIGMVPSAWAFITQMSKDLITKFAAQLNYIEFGSAFLSSEDKTLLTKWFPHTHIVMHYGLTEVSRAVFIHFHTDNLEAVGHIKRGADVAILTEDGRFADEGEIGEIVLKAPWMLTEYYQNKALSADSFVNGYFKTGDLGRLSGEYLFLTGRLKEIINVGGKKVSPYVVEEVINRSEYVKESACIALPDDTSGEVVQAFVVLSENNEGSEAIMDSLKALASQHLPVHMRPQRYRYIKSLPKTASGKVQRLKLADM